MKVLQLHSKLKKEKEIGLKIKPIMLSKGWNYDRFNNTFEKGNLQAYFYYNKLIIHFDLFVTNKAYHKIKINK